MEIFDDHIRERGVPQERDVAFGIDTYAVMVLQDPFLDLCVSDVSLRAALSDQASSLRLFCLDVRIATLHHLEDLIEVDLLVILKHA